MKEAIEKAIKGGYLDEEITSVSTNYGGIWYFGTPIQTRLLSKIETEIFLDPKFWQALGKAEGWGFTYEGPDFIVKVGQHKINDIDYKEDWKLYWHKFIDHLAEGKSAEDFFK